jgi:YD repeat-containing protein
VTTFTYDARNNRTEVNYPVSSLKDEFVYDANDNLLATNSKDGSTFKHGYASVYDERNRVIKQVRLTSAYTSGSPSGSVTSILHDKNGNVTQIWNGNASSFGTAQSKAFVYDDRNRRIQSKDGTGTVVEEIEYFEDNSIELVRGQEPAPSAGGLITIATYEYSKRGEMTEFKDTLNYDWMYEYDENGNRTKFTNPAGVETAYSYDDADRLGKIEIDPTGLDIETAFAYDAQGNRTSTTVYNPTTSSNNAVYARAYDKADRLEKLTNPNTSNYQLWTYNDHGNVATHRDANAKVVTYSYDLLGRVTSEAHGSPFSVTITRAYYAATDLPTELDDGTREIVNTYNVKLELTATDWSVSASAFKNLDFTYDAAGNRDEMIDPEGAMLYVQVRV